MDYRILYEEKTKMKIPKNFDIHHIDGNRNNNEITNLVALPKKIHSKYHELSFNLKIKILNQILKCWVYLVMAMGSIPIINFVMINFIKYIKTAKNMLIIGIIY